MYGQPNIWTTMSQPNIYAFLFFYGLLLFLFKQIHLYHSRKIKWTSHKIQFTNYYPSESCILSFRKLNSLSFRKSLTGNLFHECDFHKPHKDEEDKICGHLPSSGETHLRLVKNYYRNKKTATQILSFISGKVLTTLRLFSG